ncbi:MAG TPA: phosphoglycerate kinase, partial [Actinomycetota bacterium]|nr:phosphoglycerate kinase [Actinomycetota bacterium]
MDLPRLENADVEGRTVVVRADLNVPLQDGQVGDDFRIRAFLPTLEHLVSKGCRTVVCSHLGRPKGERRPELSLAPVAERLSELLGRQVDMTTDSVGPGVAEAARDLPPGGVLVLENLRFNPGSLEVSPGLNRR